MANSTGIYGRPSTSLKSIVAGFLLAMCLVVYLMASSNVFSVAHSSKRGTKSSLRAAHTRSAATYIAPDPGRPLTTSTSVVATGAAPADPHSIFDITVDAIDGTPPVSLSSYRGAKAFLIVNLACN